MDLNKLYYQDNYLNYIKQSSIFNRKNISILFLSGLMSNLNSTKALFLSNLCIEQDIEYIRFDYYGHGESSGEFLSGTIGMWLENSIHIINSIVSPNNKIIIIGSSLGGWIMNLVALRLPERIISLFGLAPAVDFTERLIWDNLSINEKNQIQTQGKLAIGNQYCKDEYLISYNLIKEGRNHLILDRTIEIDVPVTIIHGMNDYDVPYDTSIILAEKLKSKNVIIEFIKDAGHNLSREQDLYMIKRSIKNTIEKY